MAVAIRPHDRVPFDIVSAGAKRWPFNLEDRWGKFHQTHATDGNVIYRYSENSRPPFVREVEATTSGLDERPTMVAPAWTGDPILLTFCRNDNDNRTVRLLDSYDDGATWGGEMELWPASVNPKHPTSATSRVTRAVIYATQVGSGPYNLQGRLRYAGDAAPRAAVTFTDENGVALSVDDDTFQLSAAEEGSEGWLLTCVIGGAVKNLRSHDEVTFAFKEL